MMVLVTGGAGFIGSHLVDQLLDEGNDVRVLDNFSSGKEFNLENAKQSGKLEIIRGTVLDEKTLDVAMDSVDAVYHLAVECVRKSIGDPISNHHVNASGTLYTLEAARRHSVERFIYCSSSEVYGNSSDRALNELTTVCKPVTVYGAAKLAGELYTLAYYRTYKLPVVVVRPFNAYGPREHDQGDLAEVIPRFVTRVLNGLPPIVFGNGLQGRDFTYVGDTANGLSKALNADHLIGQTLNLGSGKLTTIFDLANLVIQVCNANELSIQFFDDRPGDVYRLLADTDFANRALGFSSTVNLQDGLHKYIDWFCKVYPEPRLLLESDVINW